jgi:hypothetical protein
MKTTIEINDGLLQRARRLSVEKSTTLRALVEEGLRVVLDGAHAPAAIRPFQLRVFAPRDGATTGLLPPYDRLGLQRAIIDTYEESSAFAAQMSEIHDRD